MTSGQTAFNKAASVAYQNISLAEKQKLNSSERLDCMGRKAIIKEGKRIFLRIWNAVIFAITTVVS